MACLIPYSVDNAVIVIDTGAVIADSQQQTISCIPWSDPSMVEQDLLISRVLVSIFSDEFLASQLAFRGGTAYQLIYNTFIDKMEGKRE